MLSSNAFKVDIECEAAEQQQQQQQAELPDDVSETSQLALVPQQYLSDDPQKPLLSRDVHHNPYKHVLKPMLFSVVLILAMEGLERLSYYGINFTQTAYLTGQYGAWSPNFTSVQASSWTSTATAIAYSVPFIGAIVADGLIGNYWTIVLFTVFFYLPGLVLIAVAANPDLFPSGVYPTTMLAVGLLGLYPTGAGGIKACVNVMGAAQYHPLLQKKQIERYYVSFYMIINVGALLGGITIPIVCQTNVFAAYMIPVVGMSLACICFLIGTKRYVRIKPQGSAIVQSLKACCASFRHCPPSLSSVKVSNGGRYDDKFVEKIKVIGGLVPIMLLIVPFNVAYNQMSTVFVVQGGVMSNVGFIDASWMQNFDAFSVLFFGYLIGTHLYPYLGRRGIKLHTMTKFSIGTMLGVVALLCDVIIEYQIHSAYTQSGSELSVMWQIFPFFFIGAGEIFAISSSYEAAYLIAPEGMKTFGSAVNLFIIGALPNFISTALLNACQQWAFTAANGSQDLSTLSEYATANVQRYLWILVAIAAIGVVIPLLPSVRRFYDRIEQRSDELLRL